MTLAVDWALLTNYPSTAGCMTQSTFTNQRSKENQPNSVSEQKYHLSIIGMVTPLPPCYHHHPHHLHQSKMEREGEWERGAEGWG